MTKDPAGFIDGPNLYSYVHNSPRIFIDPYGLLAEENKRSTWDTTRDAVRDGAKQSWNATQEFYKHTKGAVKDTLQRPLGIRGFGLVQAGFGASREAIDRKDEIDVGVAQKSAKTKWEETREADRKKNESAFKEQRAEKNRARKFLDKSKRLLKEVVSWFSRRGEIQKGQRKKNRDR